MRSVIRRPRPSQLIQQRSGMEGVAAADRELIEQRGVGRPTPGPTYEISETLPIHGHDLGRQHLGSRTEAHQLIPDRERSPGQDQRQRQVGGRLDELGQHAQRVAVGMVQIVGTQDERALVAQVLDGGQHPVTDVRSRRILRHQPDQRRDQPERLPPAGFVGRHPERSGHPRGEPAEQGVETGRLPDAGRPGEQQRSARCLRRACRQESRAGRRRCPTGCAGWSRGPAARSQHVTRLGWPSGMYACRPARLPQNLRLMADVLRAPEDES